MPIPFLKIEGLGNDYIFIDRRSLKGVRKSAPALARAISNRRTGVGSDGLIVMDKINSEQATMTVYNSDGSEAKFCGNGLRGTVLYLRSAYKARGKEFYIKTRWNDYKVRLVKSNRDTAMVEADLGSPSFDSRIIGITGDPQNCLGLEFKAAGRGFLLYCVAMPNPHAVILIDTFDFDWQKAGAEIEKSSLFRNGVNVMFAKIETRNRIAVTPWERGSGATMACGSGAAAAAVVTGLLGLTRCDVKVIMPGGSLRCRWDVATNQVYQVGPTRIAFSGSYTP